MTGTIHQRWTLGSMIKSEDECQYKLKKARHRHHALICIDCKACPAYPHLKPKLSMESLCNPSWTDRHLKRRRLVVAAQAQIVERNDKIAYGQAMPFNGESADFVALLRTCAKNKDLHTGIKLHDEIMKRGLIKKCSDALVTMYAKCGAFAKAKELLDTYKSKNVFAWTALITRYAQQGQGQDALSCFDQMQCQGIFPDAVTFACILKACGSVKALGKGEQIHDDIARQGLLRNDVVLGNALVDMYAKCGALEKAQCVLEELPYRDVVSWNTLITGYAQQNQSEQALSCFQRMQQDGFSPDLVTYSCILKACGTIGALDKGEEIHDEIAQRGLLGKCIVLGTSLVDMYAKCGALAKARKVLEELPSRDVVSWSALITGYAQQDQSEQALDCFERMQAEGLFPDAVTFACILKACGNVGAVDKGQRIHDKIAKLGLLRSDLVLGNALVDMYAKCGALAKAQQVLDELPSRDVISWNGLIAGHVHQGQGEQALDCFKRMQCDGLSPNAGTFSCVLNVCSHLGLVEDGNMYFDSMSTKYSIKPDLEHYNCIVDLFGRAGHLDKAVSVIQEMLSTDVVCPAGCLSELGRCKCWSAIWCALLGACRKWGDVNVGKWAFKEAVQLDKSDAAAYVLMANIYAGAGMEEDAEMIEAMRLENKAWKQPGHRWWTDMSGNAHLVVVAETKHAQNNIKIEDRAEKVLHDDYSPVLHLESLNTFNVENKKLPCGHTEFSLA